MEIMRNDSYRNLLQNRTLNYTLQVIGNLSLTLYKASGGANVTNNDTDVSTQFTPPDPPYNTWITVLLATLASATSFCTTVGNIMVVISFIMERSIRQPSNYLIASLAVTDIIIGGISMPFYTMYLLKSYWPLGTTVCDLWLSIDYTVCLVSQYTVFLITLDRFCSVKVPAKYRNWRTKHRMKLMIAATWVLPALIFFTTIMGWPVFVKEFNRHPGKCEAEFQKSPLFSAILVICYYWVTLFVMVGLYVGIYRVALGLHKKAKATRKRLKLVASSVKKEPCADIKGKEKLMSSPDLTPGATTSTQGSNESTADVSKVFNNTANSVVMPLKPGSANNHLAPPPIRGSENLLPPPSGRIEANPPAQPPQTLPVDVNQNGIDNKYQLDAPKMEYSVDSPIWKPRGSLPNASIHWDAFTGDTFHKVEREDSRDESNKGVSGSVSPSPYLAQRRQFKRRKRSERSSGRSEDYNDSSSETSDSDNKPTKSINQLSSMVAFLATTPKIKQERKNPSIKRKNKSENRARKALRTITFILGAFVICWTPYHVLVLVASFCKNCDWTGPLGKIYEFSYWLCYMNSPINPFCYALSNPQFKKSFIKILKFEYFRQCWRKIHRH